MSWPQVMGEAAWCPLVYPSLVSIPLGFLDCWPGSVLSEPRADESSFEEMQVCAALGVRS